MTIAKVAQARCATCLPSETVPRVMAIAVHPFVTGQPHRIAALDAALDYICTHAGVWRATGWEIVQHFLAQQPEPR